MKFRDAPNIGTSKKSEGKFIKEGVLKNELTGEVLNAGIVSETKVDLPFGGHSFVLNKLVDKDTGKNYRGFGVFPTDST